MSEKKPKTELVSADESNSQVAELEREEGFVKPHYTTRKVDDGAWEIGVLVPGVKRDDVHVSLENKELEVVARRHHEIPKSWRPLNDRGPRPNYRLELELAVEIDEERISAKLECGILTLRLPAAESAKARTISVE